MTFLLGVIIGILIRDIKVKTLHQIERLKEMSKEKWEKADVQFLEPTTFRERFNSSNDLEDLLE